MTAHGEVDNMRTVKIPIKKIKLTAAACALSSSLLFSGCSTLMDLGAKAPEMEANAESIKMYDSDQLDSMLITINGRTYAPYGGVKKSMSKSSLRECIGYLDDDKDRRLYTLNEDPFDNYLVAKTVNAFMEPDMFWRDISTIEDEIFTPEYIESFDYEEWAGSGQYNEMKSFKIDVALEAEDVNEIIMDYTINGDVEASAGVRNADYSPLKKGEVLSLEATEVSVYAKYDKDDPFDVEIEFSLITNEGRQMKIEGTYTGRVKFGDSEKLTLTGNPDDGYTIS